MYGLQCSAPAGPHWSARPPLGKKSIDFDHEIMENEKNDFDHEITNLVEINVGTPAILGRTLGLL
jgi:hypothetical protein